ncbi:hypothetical protein [Nonomuraea typhae]|uniref:hypothetical protein n=1 Tax=Nonomuraea typhae TaxID=2603600 RepID=UPI0012F7AF9D|nr:hypothetical protein [Nonomuraea typhae]
MGEQTPAGRTGRPEIDGLLDAAEHQALAELVVIGQAEDVVTRSRHAKLAAEHTALYARAQETDVEMQTASDSGDPAWIAAASTAQDRAWADFRHRSQGLIAEAQQLLAARLEHTTAALGQTGTAWADEAKARDALTGSSPDGPERVR